MWAGKTRDSRLREMIDEYVERIRRHVPVEIKEAKEEAASDRHAEAEALQKEGRRIREMIPSGHAVVLLDESGRLMTSLDFAAFLDEKLGASSPSSRGLTFVVGGHQGVDEELKRMADCTISLSRMTLTHEMSRLMVVEQIYRGLGILRGSPYHRP